MNTNYLLPNKYKKIGWLLFITGLILGGHMLFYGYDYEPIKSNVISLFNDSYLGSVSWSFFKIIKTGIAGELITIAVIIGGLLIGFTKEKIEDEFIYKLRKDSLVWAFIINYAILLLATIFIYDLTFFHVLVLNMFTPLIIFIFRFNFLKLKSNSSDEE